MISITDQISTLKKRIENGAYFTVSGGATSEKGRSCENAGIAEAFGILNDHHKIHHSGYLELNISWPMISSLGSSGQFDRKCRSSMTYWIIYDPVCGTKIRKIPLVRDLHEIKASQKFRPAAEYILEAIQWIWKNEAMKVPDVAGFRANDQAVVSILETLSGKEPDSYFSLVPQDMVRYHICPRLT